MGKARKWIRNFLLRKKEKETENYQPFSVMENIDHRPTTPISTTTPTTPKEKRRWSFRRSSATAPAVQKELNFTDDSSENIIDHKKHALAVAVATAAAADAAAAAAKAAAAVFQLTAVVAAAASSSPSGRESAYYEEAAVIKIQSAFRGYLARMALNALKGLVKLQALIRAHLVRKQASATLRCMQALVTAQERARAQRIQMVQDAKFNNHNQSNDGKSSKENRFKHSNQEFDKAMEEHIKIVEMDVGENKKGISRKSRSSCSSYGQQQTHRITTNHRMSTHSSSVFSSHQEQDHHNHHHHYHQISPSPSINDLSPKARSGHFEEYTLYTAQSSPQQQHYYSETIISSKHDDLAVPPVPPYARSELGDSYYTEYPFYPSYMANTQSSRAKVRSHSAPKQRPEMFERQLSRRNRPSIEGRNVPRAVKMQRSSSHVGQNYQYPWSSVKLDKSNMSLKDSECGSNYTVLTNNTNWIRGN